MNLGEEIKKLDNDQFDFNNLFSHVMNNNWDEVVEIYKKSPGAWSAKLTRKSKDTALHIAISNEKEKHALILVETMIDKDGLGIRNSKGNTPLHLAAMSGNLQICEKMVLKNPQLIDVLNDDGETPIFLAACNGRSAVMSYLQKQEKSTLEKKEEHPQEKEKSIEKKEDNLVNKIRKEENLRYKRTSRKNGDTILHVAISGEYFSMAMKIIDDYPDLVDAMNEHGLTPLHILAAKPNAFRRSTQLGIFDRIIYYYIGTKKGVSHDKTSGEDRGIEDYPKNYDEENPRQKSSSKQLECEVVGASSRTVPGSDQTKDGPHAIASSSTASSSNGVEEVVTDESRTSLFPPNYDSFLLFLKIMMKLMMSVLSSVVLKSASRRINKIQTMKGLHIQAKLVMKKLVDKTEFYKSYGNTGLIPNQDDNQGQIMAEGFSLSMLEEGQEKFNYIPEKAAEEREKLKRGQKEQTPMLIAAKNGVTEIVKKILENFPVAIQDEDAEQKNVLLLAVEKRQPHVYEYLMENITSKSVFSHVDHEGNSALHLAATQAKGYSPWFISGSARQMQWETKWFQFVKNSKWSESFRKYNHKNMTPNEVFCDTHKELLQDGSKWFVKTSESCSVVAALVATVSFATSSTVPGGINEAKGTPILEGKPAFNAFAISALAALCFSITALVFFLSILTSRYREEDFALDLPGKLLLGLTSLFASIVSMLVSFCAGHIFVLDHHLRYVAYPLYAALCLPMTLFAFAQLSLYFDLLRSIIKKVPKRSYEVLAR